MSEVWRGTQIGLGRPVIIKLCAPETDDNQLRERFDDEIKLHVRLSEHPAIVTPFDAGKHEGMYWLALEQIKGWTLKQLIDRCIARNAALTPAVALSVVAEICEALQFIHTYEGRGIIHRDISPDNLMVRTTGHAVVLDFGIAKFEGSLAETKTGQTVGKSMYMSPEQAYARPLDCRSDLFSLGTVTHELLTLANPFFADVDVVRMLKVVDETTTPIERPSMKRPGLSPAIDRTVLRAMSRAIEGRYEDALALRKDIRRFITTDVSHARIVSEVEAIFSDEPVPQALRYDVVATIPNAPSVTDDRLSPLPRTHVQPAHNDTANLALLPTPLTEGPSMRWMVFGIVAAMLIVPIAIAIPNFDRDEPRTVPVEASLESTARPEAAVPTAVAKPPAIPVAPSTASDAEATAPSVDRSAARASPRSAPEVRPVKRVRPRKTRASEPAAEVRYGTLNVGFPATVKVIASGRSFTTPMGIRLPAGRHRLTVTRRGHASVDITASVIADIDTPLPMEELSK